MPETETKILGPEELREEIKTTKQEIYYVLMSLSGESARLSKGLGDLRVDDYIPLMLTSGDNLSSLVTKAVAVHSLGTKLNYLNNLKNKKTP